MDHSEKIHLKLLQEISCSNKLVCKVMEKALDTATYQHEQNKEYKKICLLAYQLLSKDRIEEPAKKDLFSKLQHILYNNKEEALRSK